MNWLTVQEGSAPLIISLPHTGTDIPGAIEETLVSPWLSRKDADWHIDKLYAFAGELGATLVHTAISRTVIDVNRDPSGVSLYPGQATTGLCPMTSFDGEPLYRTGLEPDEVEITARRVEFFDPYHEAIATQITRLRAVHPRVVLYDCHSIRSVIPRLFEGTLPNFNIGTNDGASCATELEQAITEIAAASGQPYVVNGRFKGGYITRHYADPGFGLHTIQMELACRGYMAEPLGSVSPQTWPTPYDPDFARPMRETLGAILAACLAFATSH